MRHGGAIRGGGEGCCLGRTKLYRQLNKRALYPHSVNRSTRGHV